MICVEVQGYRSFLLAVTAARCIITPAACAASELHRHGANVIRRSFTVQLVLNIVVGRRRYWDRHSPHWTAAKLEQAVSLPPMPHQGSPVHIS